MNRIKEQGPIWAAARFTCPCGKAAIVSGPLRLLPAGWTENGIYQLCPRCSTRRVTEPSHFSHNEQLG